MFYLPQYNDINLIYKESIQSIYIEFRYYAL